MTEKVIIIFLNMHSLIDSSVLVLRLLHLKRVDVGQNIYNGPNARIDQWAIYSGIATRIRHVGTLCFV
jgi:hypothetical protein